MGKPEDRGPLVEGLGTDGRRILKLILKSYDGSGLESFGSG